MINIALMLTLGWIYGDWPMWGGEPNHQAYQKMVGAMTSEPVVKWRFRITANNAVEWQFSAIGDVNGDGLNEVVFGGTDRYIYCLNGTNGTQRWALQTTSPIQSSPVITNLDGGTDIEVIAINTYGRLYCLRGTNGGNKWTNLQIAGDSLSSPVVADVDGDGKKEVVVGGFDNLGGIVTCVGYTTSPAGWLREWIYRTPDTITSSPAVDDIDGDGKMEILIGSGLAIPGSHRDSALYCLRCTTISGNDTCKLVWKFLTRGGIGSSPAIGDVDGDGEKEIVVGSADGRIYCVSKTGTQKWRSDNIGIQASSVAIADMDKGKGPMEVFIGNNIGYVYCLNGSDGSLRWSKKVMNCDIHTPLSLADVDKDGKLEVLVPSHFTDTLYCLNAEDGSILWAKNLAGGIDIHSPFSGDIDGDGCIEIITGTNNDYSVYALDDPVGASNCYEPTYEDIGEGGSTEPLQFSSSGRNIYLFVPKPLSVSLSLYDATGCLVQNLYDGVIPTGSHTFITDMKARGVYLAVLREPGGIKTVKVLIK